MRFPKQAKQQNKGEIAFSPAVEECTDSHMPVCVAKIFAFTPHPGAHYPCNSNKISALPKIISCCCCHLTAAEWGCGRKFEEMCLLIVAKL